MLLVTVSFLEKLMVIANPAQWPILGTAGSYSQLKVKAAHQQKEMVNVNILLTFAECLGCIWRFRVSFLCSATSARYLDTYVRRFASQSTLFPPPLMP